jgi:hypothetical protein
VKFDAFIATPPRPGPGDVGGLRYLKSYLLIRLVIGILGFALPFLVVVGSILLRDADPWKGSISAYYHSGVGDLFVGALCATALFLLSYMAFERNFDNVVSIVAGLSALGVAFFPTQGGATSTALQDLLGPELVGRVHFTFATLFILSLAGICWRFGHSEATRTDRTPAQRRRGKVLHHGCAWTIVLAVVYIAVAAVLDLPSWLDDKALFLGESLAVFAFGTSWFVKGTELTKLLRPAPTTDDPGTDASEQADDALVPVV